MIAVKSLIVIEKIALSELHSVRLEPQGIVGMTYKAAVDVGILQIYNLLSLMKNVRYFPTSFGSQCALKDEQFAVTQYDYTFSKGRMHTWLAIQHSRHL